jgi:hypothetical protein
MKRQLDQMNYGRNSNLLNNQWTKWINQQDQPVILYGFETWSVTLEEYYDVWEQWTEENIGPNTVEKQPGENCLLRGVSSRNIITMLISGKFVARMRNWKYLQYFSRKPWKEEIAGENEA